MKIQPTGYNHIGFRNIQETKRQEPAKSEMEGVPITEIERTPLKYNWKAISALALGAAAVLLAFLNRNSIGKLVKKLTRNNTLEAGNLHSHGISTQGKQNRQSIRNFAKEKADKTVEIKPEDIIVSYEPERLFRTNKTPTGAAQKHEIIYINQNGERIAK